jgi:hypothetical protein
MELLLEISEQNTVLRMDGLKNFLENFQKNGGIVLKNSNFEQKNLIEPPGELARMSKNMSHWKHEFYQYGSISFATSRLSVFMKGFAGTWETPSIVVFYNYNKLKRFGKFLPFSQNRGAHQPEMDQMELRLVLHPHPVREEVILKGLWGVEHVEVISPFGPAVKQLISSGFLEQYKSKIPILIYEDYELFSKSALSRYLFDNRFNVSKYRVLYLNKAQDLFGVTGSGKIDDLKNGQSFGDGLEHEMVRNGFRLRLVEFSKAVPSLGLEELYALARTVLASTREAIESFNSARGALKWITREDLLVVDELAKRVDDEFATKGNSSHISSGLSMLPLGEIELLNNQSVMERFMDLFKKIGARRLQILLEAKGSTISPRS